LALRVLAGAARDFSTEAACADAPGGADVVVVTAGRLAVARFLAGADFRAGELFFAAAGFFATGLPAAVPFAVAFLLGAFFAGAFFAAGFPAAAFFAADFFAAAASRLPGALVDVELDDPPRPRTARAAPSTARCAAPVRPRLCSAIASPFVVSVPGAPTAG
jgi:hypothetical protein